MHTVRKSCLAIAALATVVMVIGLLVSVPGVWQPAVLVAVFGAAIGIGAIESVKSYQYTAWILACVIAALMFPQAFHSWGGVELTGKFLMTTIIQLVMFGMATQMRLADFRGVARHPRGVLVGLIGHYTVMPVAAFILVQFAGLPKEVGLGVILYGCVSSGLASNVMSLLARANLALAVTITAMSTIASPLMTPLLMKVFAGRIVDVSFISMMFDVIRITLVPVAAALLVDYLRTAAPKAIRRVDIAVVLSGAWLVALVAGGWNFATAHLTDTELGVFQSMSYVAAAIVVARVYHLLVTGPLPLIETAMPYASMFGIMYYNTITTAAGRDALLDVGLTLLAVGIVHNLTGYVFGYWGSRLSGLDQSSARSVSFEVGMQNGGMATGLASSMGMIGTAGLAAAVFSPLGNITGSLLANYWSRRPPTQSGVPEPDAATTAVQTGSKA
ncbi:bile acid:sodium symporter family protein [Mycobacterium sp. 21AC1]|uniref:bile acid:sodium symporter family protein n=1 Tax=[Mycobacterium] appelbergii TaxID=2939269 RepID=UPI002938E81A|nr:bile acid:sodium symporter family protein [Mycobacterium sp. 21AC1]MDV3130196.1 bile acid:sodium symporter family protein [Mycobacterium sp. 21AC1]